MRSQPPDKEEGNTHRTQSRDPEWLSSTSVAVWHPFVWRKRENRSHQELERISIPGVSSLLGAKEVALVQPLWEIFPHCPLCLSPWPHTCTPRSSRRVKVCSQQQSPRAHVEQPPERVSTEAPATWVHRSCSHSEQGSSEVSHGVVPFLYG